MDYLKRNKSIIRGKIHFDGEPRMPDHENIQGKEYYK
jgi:hypothetical protein